MNYKKKYLKYKLKYLTLKKLLSRQHQMKGGFSCGDGVCGIMSRCQKVIDNAVDTGCEWVDMITKDKVEMEDIVKKQKKIGGGNFEDQNKRLLAELKNSENIENQQKQWNEMCDKMQKNANYFSSLEKLQEEQKKIEEDCTSQNDDICQKKNEQQEKINEAHTNMRNHMKQVGNYSYFPCGISFEEHEKKQKIMRNLLPKLKEDKANILNNGDINKKYLETIEKIDAYGQKVAAGLTLLGIDGVDTAATVSSVLKIALIGDITKDNINEASKNYIGELNTNFINKIDTFVKNNPKPTEEELNVLLKDLNETEQEIVDKSRSMTGHKSGEAIKEGLVDVGKNAIFDVVMNKVLGENLGNKVSSLM